MAKIDYQSLKVNEIKTVLDENGVLYKPSDNKATLIELAEGI